MSEFTDKSSRAMKDCSMNSSPPQIPVQPIPFAYELPNLAQAIEAFGNVRIVALGSSTTAGEGGSLLIPIGWKPF
jgi:hypothetical protein